MTKLVEKSVQGHMFSDVEPSTPPQVNIRHNIIMAKQRRAIRGGLGKVGEHPCHSDALGGTL